MSKPPLKSVEEKTRIVLAVLRGEVTVAAAARREGVSETAIAAWSV
jgi:transposase